MESLVILGPTDIGLVLSDFTLTVNTLAEPPVPVDTTGATMPEYSDGLYNLIVPLATMNSKWKLVHNTLPIEAEGFFIDGQVVVKGMAPSALRTLLPYNGAMMWDLSQVPVGIDWQAEDGVTPLPADTVISIYGRDRGHQGSYALAFYEAGAWTLNPRADLPAEGFAMMTIEVTTLTAACPAGTILLNGSDYEQLFNVPYTPVNINDLATHILADGSLVPHQVDAAKKRLIQPPVVGSTPQQIMSDYKDPATGWSAMDYMRTTEARRPGLLYVKTIENGCSDFVETPTLPINAGLNAQLFLVPRGTSGTAVQVAERGADNGVWTNMPAGSGTAGFVKLIMPAGVPYPATLLEFTVRGNSGTAKFALRLPDNSAGSVDQIELFFNADGTAFTPEGDALAPTPPAEAALAPTDIQNIADTVAAAVGDEVADGTWRTLVPGLFPLGSAGSEMGQLREITTKFVEAIGQLLSHTYTAGEVHSPFAALPAPTVPMYYKTNYAGTTTVGEAWGAILATPGVKVFYTTKLRSEDKTPTIDAECVILDPVKGTIQIALTKEQLTVKTGEYFSQLQARTYTADPTPLVDQIWIMQEGKQLVKPTFKG